MSRDPNCATCGQKIRNDICAQCIDDYLELVQHRHDEWNEGGDQ